MADSTNMSKAQLIAAVADATDNTKAAIRPIIEAIFHPESGAIARHLRSGGKVNIAGFGRFVAKHRQARDGRNPATGDAIRIPAKWVVTAAISKPLRDSVQASLSRKRR